MYEVGVVYVKNSKLFLAVDDNRLLTFIRGKSKAVKPYHAETYNIVRHVSVDDLCSAWKVTTATIDKAAAEFLAPSQTGIKPAPRGSRTQRKAEQELWREIRTAKIRRD